MSFSAQYPPVLTEAGDLTSEVLAKYNQEFQYLYTNLLSALFSATTGHAHTGNGSDGAQLTAASIASDAITTLKILNEAVTAAKLATDAVTADKILADAVTTVKILNGAITTAKFSVDAKCPLAGTADKVAHTLTINGTPFDGSTDETFAETPHGQQLFTSSGTFTVPTGVTTVYVTGCGGGGGGNGGYSPTVTAGGATSFGALLTLSGGGKGRPFQEGGHGQSGGSGGQNAWESGYQAYGESGKYFNNGGDSLFGVGGKSGGEMATGYGSGGGSLSHLSWDNDFYGGGGAQCTQKQEITVISGQAYSVTIGAAGTNNVDSRCNGTAGFLLVEW